MSASLDEITSVDASSSADPGIQPSKKVENHLETMEVSPATATDNSPKADSQTSVPKRVAPKFPSPSLPNEWFLKYWFAGFPPKKIRSILGYYYKIEHFEQFKESNMSSTATKLAMAANRKSTDWQKDPYLYLIMTARGSDPRKYRQDALAWLEKYQPDKVHEMFANNGDPEVVETNLWHSRWADEVDRLRTSGPEIYHVRADKIQEILDHWDGFDKKHYHAFLETNTQRPQSRSRSSTKVAEPTPSISVTPISETLKREPIPRPKLSVVTRWKGAFKAKEGTPTPGSAQHLDEHGFFSRRPAPPSPSSVTQGRSRTPSIQTPDESGSRKGSLTALSEVESKPEQAEI